MAPRLHFLPVENAERRTRNMSFTYCPFCKGTLSLEEYRESTSCRYCGRSLADYSRRVQLLLGLVASILASVITYFHFKSGGGWANAQASQKEAAVMINGIIIT